MPTNPRIKMFGPRGGLEIVDALKVIRRANDHKASECALEVESARRAGYSGVELDVYGYRPFRSTEHEQASEYLENEGVCTFSGTWYYQETGGA